MSGTALVSYRVILGNGGVYYPCLPSYVNVYKIAGDYAKALGTRVVSVMVL